MIAQKMSYLQVVQILQELLMGLVSEAKFWVWWATICTTPNMWPVALRVEMAIKARPVGTRPGLILIDRILPDPINNRIGYGLKKKKKPRSGSPDPNPTHIYNIKKKNPRYKYSLSPNRLHFPNPNPNPNPHPHFSQPPLSLSQRLPHTAAGHLLLLIFEQTAIQIKILAAVVIFHRRRRSHRLWFITGVTPSSSSQIWQRDWNGAVAA